LSSQNKDFNTQNKTKHEQGIRSVAVASCALWFGEKCVNCLPYVMLVCLKAQIFF